MFKKVFLLTVLIGSFASFSATRAFSISPGKFLITADPGSNQTATVQIKNTEAKGVIFNLRVMGIRQDTQGMPVFGQGFDEAEQWIRPESPTITIDAGKTRSVNFFISIPPDALAWSHYIALAVEPISEKGSGVGLSGRLVSMLTLQVAGLVDESVRINKWKILSADRADKSFKLALELENNGTIEVPLAGEIIFKNWRGEDLFSQKITLGNKLLAGSLRSIETEANFKDQNLFPGPYQIQVKVMYGRTRQVASSLVYFWYLPNWVWVVGGGLALILIMVVVFGMKAIRRRV